MDSFYPSTGRTGSAKWVCPNDRQLALRAKLRTGWSVKSASLDSRSFDYSRQTTVSCPGSLSSNTTSNNIGLTEEERERIIQVIQRAEALDQSEQERVGKLVDRLENMKKNVTVVTSNRASGRSCGSRCIRGNRCVCCCALCGEKFAVVLGAGPTLCRDCRKYVCQKCGVETTTTPSSGPPNLRGQRRQTSGSISNLSSESAKSPPPQTKVFLCRICTETREMWKKSGAWFFKSLPKYVLPEKKKPRGGSRGSHWTLAGGSRSLEPSELDSSSDEEFSRRPTRTRSFLFYSKSLDPSGTSDQKQNGDHEGENDTASKKCSFLNINAPENGRQSPLSPQNQLTVPNASSSSTSPSSPLSSISPVPRSRSSSRLREQKEQNPSQSSVFYVRFPVGSSESVNHNDFSGQQDNAKSPLGKENSGRKGSSQSRGSNDNLEAPLRRSRRPSINSNGSSEMEGSPFRRELDRSPQRGYKRTESLPGTAAGTEKNEQASYGKLEITVRYEPLYHCLQCKVERAKGLRPMDIHGLVDAFCKLNILPIDQDSKTSKCLRTKTVHKTRDPEFNEQLSFCEIMENDLKTDKALHVLILQDDVAGRDFLGEAKFPLRELQPCQTKYYNVSLEEHHQVDQEAKVWGEDMSNGRGKISLSLSYNTRRRALLVTVHRANNLLAMDSNGLSDPFVKLCLTKDPRSEEAKRPPLIPCSPRKQSKKCSMVPKTSGVTHTTSVKWKTLNPEWNEEFTFEIRLTDLTAYALVISLWDKDFGKSNDYLGGLVLSCNSKGARFRQWIDAIKFPDHRHQASHELTEDITFRE